MQRFIRNNFLYFALAVLASAFAWAISFGTLPPADFTFDNSTEIKTIDPAIATGQPEGRVIDAIFEGLLRNLPPPDSANAKTGDVVPLTPEPAVAESYEVSEDGLTYTFKIRSTARWSDGTPMSAEDFRWSWMRMLHPETASEYAYQLHYVTGAEAYNSAQIEVGQMVEVELNDRPDRVQLFPRGTIVRGRLLQILQDDPEARAQGVDSAVYEIEVTAIEPCSSVSAAEQEKIRQSISGNIRVSRKPFLKRETPIENVREHLQILPDFDSTVAITASDPQTLVVKLRNPTPYFPELCAFYPLHPVNRRCIETFGSPWWAKPENVVTNGPFKLEFRRLRDRIRLVKNEKYWDAERVKLNVIDVLAIKSETTGLNMYLNGQVDWLPTVPSSLIPEVKKALPDQYYTSPMLTIYIYRLNTTRPPLDNKLVRQALARAVNRRNITEYVAKAGQIPATSLVPPGLKGYSSPAGPELDIPEARRLLAEAGFAGGRGMPQLEILYNANQTHQEIAEVVQQQWRENLGLDVSLRNLEWGVFLDALSKKDYMVSRSGWIADYPDPNTFLDMWLTDGPNNQTGWSNAQYDALVKQAAAEPDPAQRMEIFRQAEAILLDECPIICVYYQVSTNMVRPGVKGITMNPQDIHPLTVIEVEPRAGVAR